MPDYRPDPLREQRTNIIPFTPTTSEPKVAPEDDPEQWIYPQDNADDFAIGQLVGEILEHDPALAGLLIEASVGELPKGEMVRRLNDWQSSFGAGTSQFKSEHPPQPQVT